MLGSGVVNETDRQVDDTGRDIYRLDGQIIPEWRTSYDDLEASSPTEKGVVRLFHQAARENDDKLLRNLVLESHVNPNMRDAKGWTSLVRAAKCGSNKAVKFLCDAKADLNTKTKEHNSALMKATKQGHLEVVKFLTAHNAEINDKNKGEATALMIAVMKSPKHGQEIIDILLKAKANANDQKDTGYTALMIAARSNQGEVCHKLIEAMASLDMKDKSDETALDKAQKYHKQAAVRVLSAACANEKERMRKSQEKLKMGDPGLHVAPAPATRPFAPASRKK